MTAQVVEVENKINRTVRSYYEFKKNFAQLKANVIKTFEHNNFIKTVENDNETEMTISFLDKKLRLSFFLNILEARDITCGCIKFSIINGEDKCDSEISEADVMFNDSGIIEMGGKPAFNICTIEHAQPILFMFLNKYIDSKITI